MATSVFRRIDDSISYALSFNYVAQFTLRDSSNNSGDYSFYITQINLPTINTSPLEIQAGGYKPKYPSAPEFSELSFQCYCDYDEKLMQFLYKWQNSLYTHEGVGKVWGPRHRDNSGNASNVEDDVNTIINVDSNKSLTVFQIDLYSPFNTDSDGGIKGQWFFYGAWPSSINYGERSYTSYEAMQLDITLTYQYARFTRDSSKNFKEI